MSKVDEFLEHHGVKGMRWGVRKDSGSGGSRKSNKPKGPPLNPDYIKTIPLRGRKPSTLSNDELRILNNRIQLENTYKKLNPSNLQKGKAFVNSVGEIGSSIDKSVKLYNNPNLAPVRNLIEGKKRGPKPGPAK